VFSCRKQIEIFKKIFAALRLAFCKEQADKNQSIATGNAVKAGKEYAHPYFWAPFVIMEDWR